MIADGIGRPDALRPGLPFFAAALGLILYKIR